MITARPKKISRLISICLALVTGLLLIWSGTANAGEHPPDLKQTSLGEARALIAAGDLNGAAAAYEKYLQAPGPNEGKILLEHGRVEAWRGNHSRSLALLNRYLKDFGSDHDYLQDKARLLAWAARPDASLAIVSELLREDPSSFNAEFTSSIALRQDHQPAAALAVADKLRRATPSKDTADLYLAAWTPTRHYLGGSFRYYNDSDHIDHLHTELFGAYFLSPATSLGARYEQDSLTAETNSGLEGIAGNDKEKHRRLAIEASHRYAPWLGTSLSLGASETDRDNHFPTYQLKLDLSPADGLDLGLSWKSGYYLISPRAISLDIRHSHYLLDLNWRPNLRYTVVAQTSYDTFSDNNSKWAVILAPRRAVLRGQNFNLDLGVRAWQFGFDQDVNHGYYDPEKYESYMATAFSYWKISRDDGISMTAAAGILKDNKMAGFEFGWSASGNGTFGLFRDWLLTLGLSAMENQRQGANFAAQSATGSLLRRF